MIFDTKTEEKRIFERYSWCIKNLLTENTEQAISISGVHLSVIDDFSSFDYHSSLKLVNNNHRPGLTEIRYTNKEIEVDNENFISKHKKQKSLKNNYEYHRIFLCEHPSCLYIADLNRAVWTTIKPSKYSTEACYFDKYKTPHIIIPLTRKDSLTDFNKNKIQEQLRKTYGTLNEVKSILIHMTNTTL